MGLGLGLEFRAPPSPTVPPTFRQYHLRTLLVLRGRSVPTISARAHAAATAVGFSRLALHVRHGAYTSMALLTMAMPLWLCLLLATSTYIYPGAHRQLAPSGRHRRLRDRAMGVGRRRGGGGDCRWQRGQVAAAKATGGEPSCRLAAACHRQERNLPGTQLLGQWPSGTVPGELSSPGECAGRHPRAGRIRSAAFERRRQSGDAGEGHLAGEPRLDGSAWP